MKDFSGINSLLTLLESLADPKRIPVRSMRDDLSRRMAELEETVEEIDAEIDELLHSKTLMIGEYNGLKAAYDLAVSS